MRDVAARAGVSRSLVSTVYRDVPGASAQTRQRVLDAATELGYRPDDRARRLRSRDSRLIGVTLTAVQPFHVAVVEALHDVAALLGYELSVSLNTDSRPLARAVDTLLAERCAALILVGPTAPEADLADLVDLMPDVPVVVIDRYVDLSSIDAVRIDDEAVLAQSVDHLVRLGHRRIWHADGGDYVSAHPRRVAYRAAMTAHGLADEIHVLPGGGSLVDGVVAANALLAEPDLPTAVVVYNDRAAGGFMETLWHHGIRVPDDISVTGIDDIPEAALPHLSLTTTEQRPDRLARAAADLVIGRLEGAPAGGLVFTTPGPLVVRGSTAVPRDDTLLTLGRRASGAPDGYRGTSAVDRRLQGRTDGMHMNSSMLNRMRDDQGFIAALDQSGGSTPKALALYGVDESAYSSDAEMFELIHRMRGRIITSPAFDGDRILGAILFERTMESEIDGVGTAEYLWTRKRVVPFLKVDLGLAAEADGVQLMKPMPDLDDLLARATAHGVFGTKMRSVIKLANPVGVAAIVDQQFEVGRQILAADLLPIIEPEVDIHSPEKQAAEDLLKAALIDQLDALPEGQQVMLKLTLPSTDDFYADLVAHPRVLRVVALSGGYSRDEADALLRRNHGVVASFSRALSEGLSAQQTDAEFNAELDATIQSIYDASIT